MIEAWIAFALVVVLSVVLMFCSRQFPIVGGIAEHGSGPQAIHFLNVPRTGGAAVFAGIVVAWAGSVPLGLLAAVTLSFVPGLAEDLTRRVSPVARYGFAAAAGALAWTFADVRILRLDVPVLDTLLTFPVVSLALTVFAIASFTHAMNLLDGLHGLSAGTVAIALVAIAAVAQANGDHALYTLGLSAAAALLGFLMLNFPWGRIFLGDGGAYLSGTLLACLTILLVQRNGNVSPWFAMAVLAHPIVETMLTVVRRLVVHRAALDAPDTLHLHSLLYRRLLQLRWLRNRRNICNVMAASGLLMVNAATAVVAVLHGNSTALLAAQFAIYSLVYLPVWWWLVKTTSYRASVRSKHPGSAMQ